jgi:two-component system chemotaxis response regulator CheY
MLACPALVDLEMPADRKVRVLVADDEEHVRKVIARIVTALGGEIVAEAADGEQALALFESTRPELVVLDINMPGLTGDEVLARVLERDPRVLAIMITAREPEGEVRARLEQGPYDYILKSNAAEEIYRLMSDSWGAYRQAIKATVWDRE